MPRTPNNDRQNDMSDDQVTSSGNPRNNQRDEEGRFASGNQTRSRNDDTAGSGRGWFGDSEGHAQAGSHSHDYTRGSSRGQTYDDDRSGRTRNAGGQFSGGNRNQDDDRHRDEADYGAWHAYGHNRGWHSYQQRSGNQGYERNRDDEGRFASGRQGDYDDNRAYGRSRDYDDDDRNAGARGGNRNRDDEGRFTSNNRH